MISDDDIRFQRYMHYCADRYFYEYHKKYFFVYIAIAVIIASLILKFILLTIVVISVFTTALLLLYLYLKKQLKSEQYIVLSKADAEEGAEAKINVTYNSQRISFYFDIPQGVKNGQRFVARNVLFENKSGKKTKKNVHFTVKVLDK